jgi:hypothetical protein
MRTVSKIFESCQYVTHNIYGPKCSLARYRSDGYGEFLINVACVHDASYEPVTSKYLPNQPGENSFVETKTIMRLRGEVMELKENNKILRDALKALK